jgi:hypothetical protein
MVHKGKIQEHSLDESQWTAIAEAMQFKFDLLANVKPFPAHLFYPESWIYWRTSSRSLL